MSTANVPQLVVEVAFTDDPLTVSPTWTDISAYVRAVDGVRVSRGKQTEIETTASGSCSLVLDNRDRRFDPTFAAGPYFGNLKPRRAIRIRALWDSVSYPVFRGFVESWPQRYMFKRDASVPLSAYDGLAVLAESEVRSATVEYLQGLGSLSFLLMDTGDGQWFDVQGGTPAALAGGVFDTGTVDNLDGDGVAFDGGTSLNFRRFGSSLVGSISFWVQTTAVGSSATEWAMVASSSTSTFAQTQIGIANDGKIYYQGNDYNTGFPGTVHSLVKVNTGEPTHVVIVHNSNTTLKVYVNGVDQTDTVNGYSVEAAVHPSVASIGGRDPFVPASLNFTGTVQQFSWSLLALTDAQVLDLYRLGHRALTETTSARADRILDSVGWPAGLADLTTMPQVDVSEVPSGTSMALGLLQQVADSEQGRLFVAKDGKVTLHNRYWHLTATRGTATQATFSDDGSDFLFSQLGFDYSDREVANRITVSGSFGVSATDEDAASQADFGLQAASVSTILATQDEVVSMASGLIGRRAQPIIRTDAIVVQPARQTAAWPTVLGLELGDRIVVELSPVGVSPQLSQTLLVERLDWAISEDNWRLAITGSPVPSENYWILGTSALGTETVLAW